MVNRKEQPYPTKYQIEISVAMAEEKPMNNESFWFLLKFTDETLGQTGCSKVIKPQEQRVSMVFY